MKYTIENIKPLIGSEVVITWKGFDTYYQSEKQYTTSDRIISATPTYFKCEVQGKIKYGKLINIKSWKEPQCPNCKSTEILNFNKSSWDGPNKQSHIITCCICKECGILFINKNDRKQCLWEN